MAGQSSSSARPRLTVAIPTRNRPDLLTRALASVVDSRDEAFGTAVANRVEIVVSDNASDPGDVRAREASAPLLDRWPGPVRYLQHVPSVGMVDNFNACIDAASGDYLLILHDDDYLLPGGLRAILTQLDREPMQQVFLFGVVLVDLEGRERRRQVTRSDMALDPAGALRRVLTNSSFVRFPGIVVSRDAYQYVGLFDPDVGGPTDFDMWVRLFAKYGVGRSSAVTAAYTIHPGAATTSTFTSQTIDVLMRIFERARRTGVLAVDQVDRSQSAFFHQFLLGGVWRSLRVGDQQGARRVMQLFGHPAVRALGVSPRWLPVRAAFTAAVKLPLGRRGGA